MGKTFRFCCYIAAGLLCWVSLAGAQNLYLRHPAPSPDGSRICFSFQGDLWVVSTVGGRAERLTAHVGYEGYPSWSPDGKFIAYSSDRNGSFDVYLIPAFGGTETQLTSHSADDIVSGWSADSRKILFTGSRDYEFEQVWEISSGGGKERPLTGIQSEYGRRIAENRLVFTRGAIPWWRKGYRGSAGCDLYIKDLSAGSISRLTHFAGNDLNAFVTPTGAEMVYLSDSTGNYNLFRKNLISGTVVQMTNHRLDVGHPSLSADGMLVAYELGGDVYLYDFRLNQVRKLMVEVGASEKRNDTVRREADSGIAQLAVSPDAEQAAFVLDGDIFSRDFSSGSQRQLTRTAVAESDVSWSPDLQQLTYVTRDADGYEIVLASSNDRGTSSLSRTHDFHYKTVIESDRHLASPQISPDQNRIAFVRGYTQLVAASIAKLTERTLAEKSPIGDFAWSPDGRYIVFTQLNGDWFSELFIGDTESGAVEKISSFPAKYRRPRFSADGQFVYYLNEGDLFVLYLSRALAEMAPAQRIQRADLNRSGQNLAPTTIEFEDIVSRHERKTNLGNISEALLLNDNQHFVFATGDNYVRRAHLESQQLQTLAVLNSPAQQLQLAGETVFLLDGAGRIHSLDASTGETATHSFAVDLAFSRRERYEQIFADVCVAVKERFYDNGLHGTDWNALKDGFAPRLKSISEDRDFYDLLREMLGQLNASHVNVWPRSDNPPQTGMLGILPDYQDDASGMIALEILPGSPAARSISDIREFDKITAVNGVKLESRVDPFRPFYGTVGREVRIDLINRSGLTRSVALTPLAPAEHRHLVEQSRIAQSRARVDKLSNGRIAYFKLSQISPKALDRFETELREFADGKKGIIIDIRGNVGGAEHDRLLAMLARRGYIEHRPRYGQSGVDAALAVDAPIALLIDERTSSDGEIVAQGFQELGLGETIGVTTMGAVIGTESIPLLDGGWLSIPTVGWYSLGGVNLENRGVSPTVAVPFDLNAAEKGEDNQLMEAVARILAKIK